jgi:uncharacterized protein YecE (DUF72 family)
MLENVRIGTAGWSYPDWDGIVYPASRPRGFDALEYLSSYFRVIEINSTFYRTPPPVRCQSWVDRTPPAPRFAFTVKASQEFTHSPGSGRLDGVDAFKRAITPIADADKLVAVLVQYPWSLRDTPPARRRIEALARRMHPFPVALEVRHGSWARPPAREWLRGTGHTVCGIDQPVIGDSVGPDGGLPGRAGCYLRLHGRNYGNWFSASAGRDARYDYLYTREELAPWVEVIRRAAGGGVTTVILNNHFRGQAPANAFELMSLLTGERASAPPDLRRAFPRLGDVTVSRPERAGETGWLFE